MLRIDENYGYAGDIYYMLVEEKENGEEETVGVIYNQEIAEAIVNSVNVLEKM